MRKKRKAERKRLKLKFRLAKGATQRRRVRRITTGLARYKVDKNYAKQK